MLQKTDLVLLLTELQEQGVEVSNQIKTVVTSQNIPMDVIKFINEHKQLDAVAFYERLRKNYNNKRSDLYKNLVKDTIEPIDIITTLSAFALQVVLYSKHVANEELFFNSVRIEEVTRVLHNYYISYELTSAMKLIKLIRSDILAIEYANGRRDENGDVVATKQ